MIPESLVDMEIGLLHTESASNNPGKLSLSEQLCVCFYRQKKKLKNEQEKGIFNHVLFSSKPFY